MIKSLKSSQTPQSFKKFCGVFSFITTQNIFYTMRIKQNKKQIKNKINTIFFAKIWAFVLLGMFENVFFIQKGFSQPQNNPSQNNPLQNNYQEIDTLLKSNSSFEAFKAIELLEKAFIKDTNQALYWIKHAKASYQFFRYENAKKSIEKATQKEPKNDIAFFEKGFLYNQPHIKDLAIALPAYNTAINLQPKKGEYYYQRGIIYSQMQNHPKALLDYEKALSLNFETTELHLNTAIGFAEQNFLDKALLHTQKALKLDKNYPEIYATQAKIKLKKQDIKGACEDFTSAKNLGLKNNVSIPDSVCNGNKTLQMRFLAQLFMISNQPKDAVKAFEQVIIDMKNAKSDDFLNKGYCHFKLQDYPQAEKDFLQALKMPNAVKDQLYDNLSLLHFKQEQWEKSIFYATARINLRPSNPVPYIDRGTCYRILKKYKEAEIDFNKSISLETDFFRAFAYRAKLYLDMGKLQEAKDDAEKAIFINKKYDYAYLMLGQIKYAMKKTGFCEDLQTAKSLGNEYAETLLKQWCGNKR